MAVRKKKFDLQYALNYVLNDENDDDSSVGGVSSDEEEELDNLLMPYERKFLLQSIKNFYFSQKKDFFTSNIFVYFIFTSCIYLNFYPFYIISLCYHYSGLDDTNTNHLEQDNDRILLSNDDTVMPPPDNVSLRICASNVFEDDEESAVGGCYNAINNRLWE